MLKKIKVIVVDDSALMRKILSDMINAEEEMEVLDTAKNGEDLLTKIILKKTRCNNLRYRNAKDGRNRNLKKIKRK